MSFSSLPQISVVIPTHKRPALLPRAVASALVAIGLNDEVIVVADHDPDAAYALEDLRADSRLHFVVNDDVKGASATRNLGVTRARGEIILFLDDDDELACDYPKRLSWLPTHVVWGFAGQATRDDDGSIRSPDLRRFWAEGAPPARTPFRRKLISMSAGFWVRRDTFLRLGGLNTNLTLDEDTDFSCRLLAQGHQPWFTPMVGTVLDRVTSTPRLTSHTTSRKRAECYLETYQRNAHHLDEERGAARHLAHRAQRMILRSGDQNLQRQLDAHVKGSRLRFELTLKRLSYALRSTK